MEKVPKAKRLDEYKEGEPVRDVFVVKIKKGISDYSKGYYFALILTDASAKSIDYRYWGGPDEARVKSIYDSIKNDSVVHITGQVSSYQGKMQITSNEQDRVQVLERGQYNEEDFIKKTKKDLERMKTQFNEYIGKVRNEKIRLLLEKIFHGSIGEAFWRQPAAISIHHNWIHGLLEHTLEILRYCELSKELYPGLNEDILIAGAMLHDIGKIEEMEMTTRIKGTNKGQFLGHILLGSIMVSEIMKEIGMDPETQNKILHMIVSHHGKVEQGSLKEPMFPEAIALYYADESSTKLNEIFNFIESNKGDTEDEFMPKWPRNLPTNIFLRNQDED